MTTPVVSQNGNSNAKVSAFKKAFTEPLKPQKGPVNFSFSNSLKAGYTQYHGDQVSLLGINPEAKVEYKGWYAGAEVAAGTALSGKVELGKEIEFNKNWGMDVSAFASHDVNFIHNRETVIKHSPIDLSYNLNGENHLGSINLDDITVKSKPQGVFKTGIKAMANYTTNDGKFTIGAGLSGQYAANNTPNIILNGGLLNFEYRKDGQVYKNEITLPDLKVDLHKQDFVLTPELSAEYRFNDRIALEPSGNFFGGEIKVKHNIR